MKNICKNNYFNREISQYIGVLLDAQQLVCGLQELMCSGAATYTEALNVSQSLDQTINEIMLKRLQVDQILKASVDLST